MTSNFYPVSRTMLALGVVFALGACATPQAPTDHAAHHPAQAAAGATATGADGSATTDENPSARKAR